MWGLRIYFWPLSSSSTSSCDYFFTKKLSKTQIWSRNCERFNYGNFAGVFGDHCAIIFVMEFPFSILSAALIDCYLFPATFSKKKWIKDKFFNCKFLIVDLGSSKMLEQNLPGTKKILLVFEFSSTIEFSKSVGSNFIRVNILLDAVSHAVLLLRYYSVLNQNLQNVTWTAYR